MCGYTTEWLLIATACVEWTVLHPIVALFTVLHGSSVARYSGAPTALCDSVSTTRSKLSKYKRNTDKSIPAPERSTSVIKV